jgi:hypothetical protein
VKVPLISRQRLGGIAVLLLSSLLPACEDLGFQGGIIPTNFTGLKSVQAVSPEAFQLIWDAYPGASSYRVYVPDMNDPIAQPNFTTLITPPRGNVNENGEYQFSVSAVDPVTGSLRGERSNYLNAKLLPRFNFAQGEVLPLPASPPSRVAVRVSWPANPTVSYRVYLAERQPTGSIQYNFVASSAAASGVGSVDIEGLSPGREYCAVVFANYLDGTSDAPNGSKLTGSMNSLLVGPGGGFSGSVIASSQKCARTVASQAFAAMVSSTTVYSSKATLSNQPTFYVQMGSDTIDDNAGATARTSIYQVDSATGLGTYLGATIGTGKITSNISIPTGRYKFFAMVSDLNSTAQAKKEIVVGTGSASPLPENERPWVYIRGMSLTNSDPTHYPEKLQGGAGAISIGSSVAMGDFNCDGRKDLAVSADNLTVMLGDNRPAKTGLVKVYYDVSQLSSVSPQTRSQHITFDISDQYSAGRDLGLGTLLYAMNINSDTQKTNNPPVMQSEIDQLKERFQCDDLVIASSYGPMFVLYGKRDVGGPNGGLNYLGPKSYVLNPSAACSVTGICQPSMYAFSGNPALKLGRSFTSGDFDGDGFQDLAASSTGTTGIWVFRGSEYGLISPKSYSDTRETVSTISGPGRESFPYIPGDPTGHPTYSGSLTSNIDPQAGWGSGSFGTAVASFRNAYYDASTKRIRDILLVSNPIANGGAGRVFACIPKTIPAPTYGSSFSNDSAFNLGWDCNHYIDPPTQLKQNRESIPSSALSVSGFGNSMTDLVNPLRYQLSNFEVLNGCMLPGGISKAPYAFGNCSDTLAKIGVPGGVAIGASGSNAVYVYYGLHRTNTTSTRDDLGAARSLDFTTRIAPQPGSAAVVTAVKDEPCVLVPATSSEDCSVQLITQSTTPGGGFGSVVAALPGNNNGDIYANPKEVILAVAAPSRNVTIGATTYTSVGNVQLFQQRSNFSNDPIKVGTLGDEVSRFSTGFSNTLTSTINYDGPLNDQIQFGAGGIAAGPLLPDPTGADYLPVSDVVIGTPGHVKTTDSAGAPIIPVYSNGAALVFFSHSGTLRTYIPGAAGTQASPWHMLDAMVSSDGAGTSVGQESDVRFHQAFSPGDINSDGIDDVLVRMAQGRNRNSIRHYPSLECRDSTGLSCVAGIKKTANVVETFGVMGDITGGMRFLPAGRLTGGTYGSLFITGQQNSYLYFFGTNGVIQGVPADFSAPRRFSSASGTARDLNGQPTTANYLPFRDNVFFNNETGGLDTTLRAHNSFASGDFNGDGFGDFAFGISDQTIENGGVIQTTGTTCPAVTVGGNNKNRCLSSLPGAPVAAIGRGRVVILYGGANNGPQIQADANRGYPLQTEFRGDDQITYGVSTLSQDSTDNTTTDLPCAVVSGSYVCRKMQVIGEPLSSSFGSSLAAIPLGTCQGKPVHGLAVRGVRTNAAGNGIGSDIWVYRPQCTTTETLLGGLVGAGKIPSSIGVSASQNFGVGLAAVAGILGNDTPSELLSHLVISDYGERRLFVIPFVKNATLPNSGFILPAGTGFDTYHGRASTSYSNLLFLNGSSAGTGAGFGESIAAIGDVNADGFQDVGINVSRLNRRETNTSFTQQGAILILFGSHAGLQVNNSSGVPLNPVANADCFLKKGTVGGIDRIISTCNPTLLFAPQPATSARQGAYEMTFLSPFSRISTGTRNISNGACLTPNSPNECLGSFLFGVPGRDGPGSGTNILQGGGFYYVP